MPARKIFGGATAIGLVIVLLLAWLSAASAAPAAQSTVNISMMEYSFSPANLTVLTGTTVIWTNSGTMPHTSTSNTGVWDSGSVAVGSTFSYTFNTVGSFPYHCTFHQSLGMVGTITVVAGGTPSPSPTGTPPTATPTVTNTPTTAPTSTPTPVTPTATPTPMLATVSILDTGFTPQVFALPAGTTVIWVNNGANNHTTTSDTGLWDSGVLVPLQTFTFTFNNPGSFGYHDALNPTLVGTIVIQSPPATSTPTMTATATPTGTPPTATPTFTATATPTATPSPTGVAVSITDTGYTPQVLSILPGTLVIWTNNGSNNHTVTSDTGVWDSGVLVPLQGFSFTFNTAGSFGYHDTLNPTLTGTIVVQAVTPVPTSTPLLPTATPAPSGGGASPTNTPVPATSTPVPVTSPVATTPTATAPTGAAVVPTATPIVGVSPAGAPLPRAGDVGMPAWIALIPMLLAGLGVALRKLAI